MTTYLALLRGINVSGQKPLRMEELRNAFLELGYINVQTYVQSGNVVFKSEGDVAEHQKRIATMISDRFGYDVPVLVRTSEEWNALVVANPWNANDAFDPAFFHVTLLAGDVRPSLIDDLQAKTREDERVVLGKQAVYLYCPNGYGRTKLNNNFIESKSKCSATTRNWKTVLALQNLLG